jgi:signal transduction histidine kinase
MDFFRLMANNKGIELNNNISSSIIIKTDKTILGIIIQNLISNAIKFTNKGGCIKISVVIKKSALTILVADTGMGMPAKTISAIERQKPITILPDTDNLKGNGLGWMLMQELILLLKGTFKITSKINKGTTVRLQFPIC